MNCPRCQNEIIPDSYFCTWCDVFVPAPGKGEKAGFFARWAAATIDVFIPLIILILILYGVSTESVVVIALLILYGVWCLFLFREGRTLGKLLLGLQVVSHRNGENPVFWKMLVREIFGKFISLLFLGIGYIWAIFDKHAQAWHDKIMGTVVLKLRGSSAIAKKSVEKPVPSRRKAMEESFYQPAKSPQPGVVLVFVSGPMQGRQFAVEKEIFRIGANPENDLVISGDDYVSGKHACLRYHKGDLLLADQQSRNGTFLNDHRLTNVPLLINVGDQIRVGNSTFQVAQARYQRV